MSLSSSVSVFVTPAAHRQRQNQPDGFRSPWAWAGWAARHSASSLRTCEPAASGGAYRLFDSETELGAAGSFEARVGIALTRRYGIEGRAAISRPELQTFVSSDAETTGSFTLEEQHRSVRLRRRDRDPSATSWATWDMTPFASAGIGYVRQLHEGSELVEDGTLYYVGGGLSRVLLLGRAGLIRRRASVRICDSTCSPWSSTTAVALREACQEASS